MTQATTYDLIIIGSGLAGYTLAREFHKLDSAASLLVITRDDGAFYSKPMLSNALAGGKLPEQLVMKPAAAMREELAAEILTATEVTGIQPQAHVLQTSQGELCYRRLVLALGAKPRQLPLQGEAAGSVMSVNSLDDYRHFRQQLQDRRRVAVIGPGLVGCEFANDLLRAGYEVDVIGPNRYPLDTLLPPAVGERMQQVLADKGLRWHLQTSVSRIEQAAAGVQLQLAQGEVVEADRVLSAIGLQPATELAQAAGLQVARGIVTDAWLRSSEPDIYALGDCAEVAGLWLPFVMPIMNAARALAKTLHGEPTRLHYPPMPVVVKTPDFPLVVATPPRDAEGQWHIDATASGIRALFKAPDERLLGFVLCQDAVAEKQALTRELPALLE